ncbi:MAG: lipoyl synthase, partial [Calditrichaeota bacterium]
MDGIVKEKSTSSMMRKPDWLKVRLPGGERFLNVKELVKQRSLHTVCESAHCPNIGECWNRRTATFMIMGDQCTRNCRFCAVQNGIIEPLDVQEPSRVADAVAALNLKYAVITSVTRDDLDDGGAFHFAQTIQAVRKAAPECKIEVLIPDLKGSAEALQTII